MLPATISIDTPHSSENLVESPSRVSARNRSLARSRGSSSSPEPTRSVFLSGGQNSFRRGYERKDRRIQKRKKKKKTIKEKR